MDTVHTDRIEHLGDRYDVVTVRLGGDADVRLYGGRSGGISFEDAARVAAGEGRRVVAMTNAGMYGPDDGPVGLFIRGGETLHAVNLDEGEGNFYLMPNGVFWLDAKGAHVDVTAAFPLARSGDVALATQSGPMLLIDGAVHPAFRPASENKLPRSGVGVSPDGKTVYLALSASSVRFHDMATLFRDALHCDDALFLDGVVSFLWDGRGTAPASPYAGAITVTVPAAEPSPVIGP